MKIRNLLRRIALFFLHASASIGERFVLDIPEKRGGGKIIFGQFSYHKLFKITVTYVEGEGLINPVHEIIVREGSLVEAVNAQWQLYVFPGNPHAGGKVHSAERIAVSRLFPTGPYWWSTSGLGKDESTIRDGAIVYEWRETWVVYDREKGIKSPPYGALQDMC